MGVQLRSNTDSERGKTLSCLFLSDVLCSFRVNEKFGVMDRCLRCCHYKRFLREMADEDEKVMSEIDKIRRYGYPKRFDVSKE